MGLYPTILRTVETNDIAILDLCKVNRGGTDLSNNAIPLPVTCRELLFGCGRSEGGEQSLRWLEGVPDGWHDESKKA